MTAGMWLRVGLALLQIVNKILDYTAAERARQEGRDEEIARESAAILKKTEAGKRYLDEFTRNPGSSDDFLRKLEPK